MSEFELSFCARGRIAERASLELRGTGGLLRTRGVTRTRIPSSRTVFEISARSESSISLDVERLEGRFVQTADESLVAALVALASDRFAEARRRLDDDTDAPDAVFLGGALALLDGDVVEAERAFDAALRGSRRLGRALRRYGIDARLWFELTPTLSICVRPERESLLFAQAQLLRELGREESAQSALTDLRRLAPQDMVLRLCLADLLLARKVRPDDAARRVLRLSDSVTNTSTLAASLLLLRARALRRLGRSGAAFELCSRVVGRVRGRPRALILAFQLERACAANDLRDYESEQHVLGELARLAPGYAESRRPLDLGTLS